MPQPGMTSARGEDWLVRKVQDLERAVQQLAGANVFGLTGITPEDGGTSFDGYVHVNGPMTVSGTLTLPAGIIGNDALTDPTVLATSGLSQNNFATSVAGDVFAQTSVAVPTGYTRASVICMVVAGAVNNTGAVDYLYAASCINAINGGETPEQANASGGYASTAANGIRTLTGLSGGSITLGCFVRTGASWAANTANFANMNAFIYFQR